MKITPPHDEDISATILCAAFSNVTNSYKFLWFRAILEKLQASDFSTPVLNFDCLVREMLVQAYVPSMFFKLSLGSQDLLGRYISNALRDIDCGSKENKLREALGAANIGNTLDEVAKYVPYRFLRPWHAEELRRVKDAQVNSKIKALSNEEESGAPYSIVDDQILIKPAWMKYIKKNFSIISGWLDWSFARYLQEKNPAVPGITSKLRLPDRRGSLNGAREKWRVFIQQESARTICIYSGKILSGTQFSLDHFIPWSYVAHDQVWNLVPVALSPGVNSLKSNFLPHDDYIAPFSEIHFDFCEKFKGNESVTLAYMELTRLSIDELNDKKRFLESMKQELMLLKNGALRLGFRDNWRFVH